MAIVIITHDLGVVAEIADEIAVMYAGRIVEHAPTKEIFARPQHPYTWGLLKSIPRLDVPRGEELVPIPGRPPSLIHRPTGCHFHPRCPFVQDDHKTIDPHLEPVPGMPSHEVACLLSADVRASIWRAMGDGQPPAALRRLSENGGGGTATAVAATAPSGAAQSPPGADVAEGASGTGEESA